MKLGIDPGLSGAFAVYDHTTNEVVVCTNIPTLTLRRNNKEKQAVDIHALLAAMRCVSSNYPLITASIELVGAMPGQGVSSMFSFGDTNGCIKTAVAAAGIPYSFVTPGVWKKALQCPADKDGALLRASQLMPKSSMLWTPERGVRTKEDCKGLAEAALIAYWGAKIGGIDSCLLVA